VHKNKAKVNSLPSVLHFFLNIITHQHYALFIYIQVSQKWRTNYLLPYPGCLNVHEKNMEKIFQTKKLIIIIFIINGNTM
jgi:hypothetical protein